MVVGITGNDVSRKGLQVQLLSLPPNLKSNTINTIRIPKIPKISKISKIREKYVTKRKER
jgi:hypothetical protein